MNKKTDIELKKCPKCKEFKNRKTEFYQIKGQLIKVSGLCKHCLVKSNAEKRRVVKQKAVEYLGGCCKICGYNKCIGSLDFHHINRKEKDIDYSLFKTIFNKRLTDELDKCILLCANCNRELHYNEKTLEKH